MNFSDVTVFKKTLSSLAIAGGLTAATLGGAAVAIADPPPPPPAPMQGEVPPDWAPPKPAEFYEGQPVVWNSHWNGRWGVWLNGFFLTLT